MAGADQSDLLENKLDVSSLFDADLQTLAHPERACLDFIAQRAPVDWFEVIEMSGTDTLKSLIDRKLVIRSDDRLNIYWDIFMEYILTKKVPVIPLRYLPSTDFSSIYTVAQHLEHAKAKTGLELVECLKFSEGTVLNIGSDMIMFGIATRDSGSYSLASEIAGVDTSNLLRAI